MGPASSGEPNERPDLAGQLRDTVGAWREDGLLVVERGAALPDRCILTGELAAAFVTTRLYWHRPVWYLALFVLPMVYVIYLLMFASSIEVTFAVSHRVLRRRRVSVIAAWTALAVGLLCISVAGEYSMYAVAMVGGLLMVAAVIGWIAGTRYVWASRIESGRAWIKGVHPGYLDLLPDLAGLPNKGIKQSATR